MRKKHILPASENDEDTEMSGLCKRELIALSQLGLSLEITVMPTLHRGEQWWKMNVISSHSSMGTSKQEIQTALGKTKLWRQLSAAIAFINESCPQVTAVTVVIKPIASKTKEGEFSHV